MNAPKKLHLLHLTLALQTLAAISMAVHQASASFCSNPSTHAPPPLNRMILCKSHKPFLRTSIGLFPISAIDRASNLITVSHHPSCLPSDHFVSPSLLSAGLATPYTNSLLLFNCTNPSPASMIRNCSRTPNCGATNSSSCLIAGDGFDPKALNCSHYSWVFKTSRDSDDGEEFQLGSRVSVEVTGHFPDVCGGCHRADGNCGVALRCLCNPKECSDKAVSIGGSLNPTGSIPCSVLLPIIVVLVGFLASGSSTL